ncbi:cell division protein FtsL [Aquimonas sp.]|uniref:cell division protein FtsL n=1 Tax=Aquimonas sp. TaxID=1872588 RepID=UPI0037BF8B63
MRVLFGLPLVLALIGTGIAVVHSRHQHRLNFIELNQLEAERDELNIDFGRLQLEQATWGETFRIERVAREQLGMRSPEPTEIRVVRQ